MHLPFALQKAESAAKASLYKRLKAVNEHSPLVFLAAE